MKHVIKGLVVALLIISTGQVFAVAGRDVTTNTYACCTGNCQNINCQAGTANAVGDTKILDVANVKFVNLGTISATKQITLSVPTEDSRVGYNVVFPAVGKLSGQTIQFIGNFETEAGEVVYKFYRKLPGAKVWTEVGTLHASKALSAIKPVITPDGAIIAVDNDQIGIMYIATEAGNVPQAAKTR